MISTKRGDGGYTSLPNGTRVKKSDPIICFFGSMDELISFTGYVSSKLELKELLEIEKEIQYVFSQMMLRKDIDKSFLIDKDNKIKEMESTLPKLRGFILPYGKSALIHLIRTNVRKCERKFVKANLNFPNTQKYLNRLSDYIFLIAYKYALEHDELKLVK